VPPRTTPTLQIAVLGPLNIRFAGKALPPLRRSVRRLLVYVAINSGRHSRSDLARHIFPGHPDESARTKLRQALFHLSSVVSHHGSPLEVTREWVEVRENFPIVSDYEKFMQGGYKSVTDCMHRIALYRGPFLSDEVDDVQNVWNQFVVDERKVIDKRLGSTYHALIEHDVARKNFDHALQLASDWFKKKPTSDAACLACMKLLAQVGRSNEALRLFSEFQERCASQLGMKPQKNLQTFRDILDLSVVPAASQMQSNKTLEHALDTTRWKFVTVLAIAMDVNADQISELLIEQHLIQHLDLAQQVAQACGGSLSIAEAGAIELLFGWDTPLENGPHRALQAAFELRRLIPRDSAPRMGIHYGRVMDRPDSAPIGSLHRVVQAVANANTQKSGVTLSQPALELLSYGSSTLLEVIPLTPASGIGMDTSLFWLKSYPAYIEREFETSFIGRDAECLTIQQAAQDVITSRRGQIIWIIGQAGIGKTRLLKNVADNLPPGMRVVQYACAPIYQYSILHPIAVLIHETLKLHDMPLESSKSIIKKLLTDIGEDDPLLYSIWLVWLGLETDKPTTQLVYNYKALLYESVLQVLTSQLFPQDRALLVEDIHWADAASLEWFRDYLHKLHERPVLLIVSTRHPMPDLQKIATHETTLHMEPWDADTARRFIRSIPHWTVNAQIEDAIIAQGCGIPFYIESLARHTLVNNQIMALPGDIQSVLEYRIAKARFALDMVQIAAVMGDHVTLPVLQGLLSNRNPDTLVQDAEHLVKQGFWVSTDTGWSYRHDLLREAVYVGIPQGSCKTLHRNAALWLESNGYSDPSVLAYHFERGDEPHAAARYHLIAGRRALLLNLYNDVAVHYLRATELLANCPADLYTIQAQAGHFLILRMQQGQSSATMHALEVLEQSCQSQNYKGWHYLAAQYGRWMTESSIHGALAALRQAEIMVGTIYDPEVDPQLSKSLCHYVLGWSHLWLGLHLDQARDHLQSAIVGWREEWADSLFVITGYRYREYALAYLALMDAMHGRHAVAWVQITEALESLPDGKFLNMRIILVFLYMTVAYWTNRPEMVLHIYNKEHKNTAGQSLRAWGSHTEAAIAWSLARIGRKSPPWSIAVIRKDLAILKRIWSFTAGYIYFILIDICIRNNNKKTPGLLFAAMKLVKKQNINLFLREAKRLSAVYQSKKYMETSKKMTKRRVRMGNKTRFLGHR
jgi:DNA-binding SARP family transcriptional activator